MNRPKPLAQPSIPSLEGFLREPVELGQGREERHAFDRESAQAIRAAIAAERPLLVRGEPGVGKTQLAAAAAKVLKRPLVSRVVDSRTESQDLLWTFDAVMRLADAQAGAASLSFLTRRSAGADGECLTAGVSSRAELRKHLDVADYLRPGPIWWAFAWDNAKGQADRSGTPEPPHDPEDSPSNGCVLLIDEIDKGDTDVPNGLLEALGARRFTPLGRLDPVEMGEPPPLVVITTNEERVLPPAFVRRCLVLHLTLPESKEELIEFLAARAEVHFPKGARKNKDLFRHAALLLVEEREEARGQSVKPLPGQAEYLDMLRAAIRLADVQNPPRKILDAIAKFALKKQAGAPT